MKKFLPLLVLLAACGVPLASADGAHILFVDGAQYGNTHEAGATFHWEAPNVPIGTSVTFPERSQTWTGQGYQDCEGGLAHWISNENNLVQSGCVEAPTTTPAPPPPPVTTTTLPNETTTSSTSTTTSSTSTTTTCPDCTPNTVVITGPSTTTPGVPNTFQTPTTTVPGIPPITDPGTVTTTTTTTPTTTTTTTTPRPTAPQPAQPATTTPNTLPETL